MIILNSLAVVERHLELNLQFVCIAHYSLLTGNTGLLNTMHILRRGYER